MDHSSPYFDAAQDGSEPSLILPSSPCPSRPSTQSSLLSLTGPQTPPSKILNLDENPTPSEIATFPFELFNGQLRAATPPRLSSAKVAWWWVKGFRMRLTSNNKKLRWVCRLCVRKRCRTVSHFSYESNGSANIIKHLRDVHGIKGAGSVDETLSNRGKTLMDHFGVTSASADQRVFSTILGRVRVGAFEELLVDWITHDNLPFRIVESDRLRRLIEFISPLYKDKVPSAAVLRSRLRSLYVAAKGAVTEHLKSARGKIHITFDGWTSRHQLSLLGVNCFFVDKQWRHRTLLLAIPAICGRHTGDNLANEVADVLAEWNIESEQLGYMVLDNASNNNTAMVALGNEFGFDPNERRLRCLGHSIQLAVRRLLFGEAADAMESIGSGELDCDYDSESSSAYLLTQWRRSGPIGRLHNLNAAILHSPQNLDCIMKWQEEDLRSGVLEAVDAESGNRRVPLRPIADNETRWNSKHRMMVRALLLRRYFTRIVEKAESAWEKGRRKGMKPALIDDKLSEDDWDVVEVLIQVLAPFDEISVRLQGNPTSSEDGHISSGLFWEYFPSFEYLLAHLENLKQSDTWLAALGRESAQMMVAQVNLAWMKLNEYYSKLWPVAYIGAVVLHPCFGWPAIRYHWEGHEKARCWEEDYCARLVALWKDEYADAAMSCSAPPATTDRAGLSGYDAFLAHTLGKHNRSRLNGAVQSASHSDPVYDEWEQYFRTFTPADEKYQLAPLLWWKENEMKYPRLSRMASDLLSIPSMSAETERSFSSAGRMVSPLRTRLDRHTIGMAQSMRSWSREGIVLPSWQ
ncbi:hypothetical protein NLG97_g234 [Lecanicillium saksenae]|uniref:Uncharacterized protein n=1 Tax=Lecanicillium saksenae TaxID=468837 RepID=A0ACC1R7A7_9HYPO|nr:hypothetical protein NLG97_g234 [Lecanicillium saksenae]